MWSQLIADRDRAPITLKMFVNETARIIRILVEKLGRKQGVTDNIPRDGVTDIIQGNIV